ncbi:helix-turn-helix domain-containing protein [Rhodopirellula sp. SWK7]|uniref:helix-turn-helix domain-containing protein n=1 Tax=Rhodopirellula sp. SWK7 TaxID=595460 RepID=UPI000A00ED1D
MTLNANLDQGRAPENARHLLTFTEAGKIAGVSRMTIAKWVDSGELASCRMPKSKHRRVQRGVFMAFLDSLSE